MVRPEVLLISKRYKHFGKRKVAKGRSGVGLCIFLLMPDLARLVLDDKLF